MSSNTIRKSAGHVAAQVVTATRPAAQNPARTVPKRPTSMQFDAIADARPRHPAQGPRRQMAKVPGSSPGPPYAAWANRYGDQGRLAQMPNRSAQPTSDNVAWAASSETSESALAVRSVVVIGYAEGNELLAAKNAYANASVLGIETDANAVNRAGSRESGLGGQTGIQVAPPMDFSKAVVAQHVKPGEAERIVMAYVAPYMDDKALGDTFAHAAHVQKYGDRFSLSTYGSRHAYAVSKGLNIRSASEMIDMAKANGYVLDRARVRVAREKPQMQKEQVVGSPEDLIGLDRNLLKSEVPDAWHTMDLTFRKVDNTLD